MKKSGRVILCMAAILLLAAGCANKAEEQTESAETTGAADASSAQEAGGTEAAVPAEKLDPGRITKLAEYKGLELTKDSTKVSDQELEEWIQGVLDANPEYTEVSRAAKDGDIVNIDYVGKKDGVAFEGGTAQGYDLELGSGSFIDGFEDGLIGVKAGEKRSLDLSFPDDYMQEDLAGKAVVFEVTVNTVSEVKDAVLDDDFVQGISDFSTVDEFKADGLKNLQENKELEAEINLQNAALKAVIDASEFDLNEDAVEQEYNEQMEYYTSMVSVYGMELEDYTSMFGMTIEDFEADLRKASEDSLKQDLVIAAIAEAEKLEPDEAARQFVADQVGMNLDVLKESYAEQLESSALAYTAISFIVDNANVKNE